MEVDAHEFVSVMAPALIRAAALAAGTSGSVAIHKAHESVLGSEAEIDRASRVDILSRGRP
jgi:hypothetical protein